MQNDLISRSERLRQIRQTELDDCRSAMLISDAKKMIRTFIEEAPAVDAVSRSVFEQIKWERDCAMQQLKDHGIPFGGVAPAVDAVEVDKAMAWLEGYTMTDTKQIYSNGIVFVPLFRVEQAFVDKAYNGLHEV